jgi:hypothetical protein
MVRARPIGAKLLQILLLLLLWDCLGGWRKNNR